MNLLITLGRFETLKMDVEAFEKSFRGIIFVSSLIGHFTSEELTA
jgi:hypothetical protein